MILLIAKPPNDLPREIRPYALPGALLLTVLFLGAGIYGWTHPSLALRFKDEGLWVQKHKILVPWSAIDYSEVVSPHQRRTEGQKLLTNTVDVIAGRDSRRDAFLTITLTDAGRRSFAGRQFISQAVRKALLIREDIYFNMSELWGGGIHELAKEITQRAQAGTKET